MSSFSLRLGGFWWRVLAVDFGFFFGWGVGSAHWRWVRFGLHRDRRRLREEIKERTLLRHVSKRALRDLVFNDKKQILYSIPADPELSSSTELLWSWEFAGKRCWRAGREEEGHVTLRTNRKLCVSVYTTHVADSDLLLFSCRTCRMHVVS